MQLAKTQLQQAADAAARYAAPVAGQGSAAVRTRAKDAADDNVADGTPIVLADADIEYGNWSTGARVFTANATPLNAVRVTARRNGASAVPLMFARVIGKTSCDVQATATAYSVANRLSGFVGLDAVTFKNNTWTSSYNSASTTNPHTPTTTAIRAWGPTA